MMFGSSRSLTSGGTGLACLVVSLASCAPAEPPEAESDPDWPSSEVDPREPVMTLTTQDQRLERHMELMAAVPEDSLLDVLPVHLEEVGAILDEMEPMSMGIQPARSWRSTIDSVQNDLARMRDMGAEQLGELMPNHIRRMERLIFLRDSVMGAED